MLKLNGILRLASSNKTLAFSMTEKSGLIRNKNNTSITSHQFMSNNSYLPRQPVRIGNPHFQPFIDRSIVQIWERHWLMMMKHKANLEGVPKQIPRCSEANWNLEAELKAFLLRLQIQVPSDLLCAAFTEPIEEDDDNLNNILLGELGYKIISVFVHEYLLQYFPNLSNECHNAVSQFLMSDDLLSHLSSNLGITDFIQSHTFPYTKETLSQCLCSTVAAIYCGENGKLESAKFIQDFVISQLIGKDIICDIWKPLNPMKLLTDECKRQNLGEPEVRLTKRSGVGTILPVYFVGLYINKELFVESGGETLPLAETDAAQIALKKLYNVSPEKLVIKLNLEDSILNALVPNIDTTLVLETFEQNTTKEIEDVHENKKANV